MSEIDYNDGKIHAWSGGECPVHPKSMVNVSAGGQWDRDAMASAVDWDLKLLFYITKQHIFPPKPLEMWVNVYGEVAFVHKTRDMAERALQRDGRTVHMREVTE